MGMCALYEGCAASQVGPLLEKSWRPTQNTDRLRPASSSLTTIHRSRGVGRPLYRPRDNFAMLHGAIAKLMRMSTRNMW
jgi:hypothetical protein